VTVRELLLELTGKAIEIRLASLKRVFEGEKLTVAEHGGSLVGMGRGQR